MSNVPYVLLVVDDAKIRSYLANVLSTNGYGICEAESGQDALKFIACQNPNLILLELSLPDMDGTQMIRSVRTWASIPIIVLSARNHERDKVTALDLGADDYITKPFGIAELMARMRAVMRRGSLRTEEEKLTSEVFHAKGLMVDADNRLVTVDERRIHLTQVEFRILALLCKHPGKVLTHTYIIKHVWGPHAGCDNQILRVNIANIRRKLELDPGLPQYILTEINVGYRMVEQD